MASKKSPEALRTIGEAAEYIGENTHTLRNWEQVFSCIRPIKRASGHRYYRPKDILMLQLVQTLLRDHGYSRKGVQKIISQSSHQMLIKTWLKEPSITEKKESTTPSLFDRFSDRLEPAHAPDTQKSSLFDKFHKPQSLQASHTKSDQASDNAEHKNSLFDKFSQAHTTQPQHDDSDSTQETPPPASSLFTRFSAIKKDTPTHISQEKAPTDTKSTDKDTEDSVKGSLKDLFKQAAPAPSKKTEQTAVTVSGNMMDLFKKV